MFEAKLADKTQPWKIAFSGDLNEHAAIPQFSIEGQKTVVFDFTKLETVNSSGLQQWIRWVEKLPQETACVFEKLPPCFVSLLGSVRGMLPPKAELGSFFVPYFDPASEQIVAVEFNAESHFNAKQIQVHFRANRPGSEQPLEIDVPAQRYFGFMKLFYPDISIAFKETL